VIDFQTVKTFQKWLRTSSALDLKNSGARLIVAQIQYQRAATDKQFCSAAGKRANEDPDS
jgi:hypothetical protein